MTAVTVTSTIGATCHYWITPQADVDVTGNGIVVADTVHGWIGESADSTPVTLSLDLDDSYLWDVILEFRGAAPIIFEGLAPENGDLLEQLNAQGWIAL